MRKHPVPGARELPLGLVLVYEDRDIIVVNKPPGLLTISTDRHKERTAHYLLNDYVRKGSAKSRNRVFVVHRLDRETSGLLVFARSEEGKVYLQENWTQVRKKYLAVVHGTPDKPEDKISSYLAENRMLLVYQTSDPEKGRLSHTAYRVIKETKDYALLEVNLLTGRKHQIRVHMAGIGHPVVGDRKYGPADDRHARLALHAYSLTIPHPWSGKEMTFTAPVPGYFQGLVGRIELGAGEAS